MRYLVIGIQTIVHWGISLFVNLTYKCRGVDFISNKEESETVNRGGNRYEATHVRCLFTLRDVLSQLDIEGKSIVDIGSGKGYMLNWFSKFPFKCVAGVEISESLAQIAKTNAMRLKKEWRIYNEDSSTFAEIDEFDYFYLYNPFGPDVMEKFMASLRDSIYRNNREIVVLYFNPVCESILLEKGGVDCTEKYNISQPFSKYLPSLRVICFSKQLS